MFQVPRERIARFGESSGYHVPTAIDLRCARCRRDVTFVLAQWSVHQVRGQPISGRCPRCAESTTFIRLGGKAQQEARLFVDAERVGRDPLPALSAVVAADMFSPRLKKAYESALRALENSDPEATAVHCRRVLEGVTSALLSAEENRPRTLARRLEQLAKNHADLLARPVLDLSESLKDGGNLGAHFDDEADATIEDAEHMVELLDILITYLFVLPAQVRAFRTDVLGEDHQEA